MTAEFRSMKSRSFALAIALLGFSVGAVQMPLDVGFDGAVAADGLPRNWAVHTYGGYMPQAETVVVDGGKSLRFFGVRGKEGAAIRTAGRLPGTAGDLIKVRLKARGTGTAWFTLYCWEKKVWGNWVRALPAEKIELTPEWRDFEATFVLTDVPGKTTRFFEVALGLKPGADASFADVSVHRPLATRETIWMDDFETAAVRPGSPEIVMGDIAPGLLVKTRQGRYVTDGAAEVSAACRHAMPTNAGCDYLVSGVRVYSLGASRAALAAVEMVLGAGDRGRFALRIGRTAGADDILCSFVENGREAAAFPVPRSALPADFDLAVGADGLAALVVTSLADSRRHEFTVKAGCFAGFSGDVIQTMRVVSGGGRAEATLDNMSLRLASVMRNDETAYPHTAKPEPTFDPVASGWPLVFSDEFDGVAIDTNKWTLPSPPHRKYASLSGDGRLLIKADYKDGSTNELATASLWSVPKFRYGYFEARVKFTHESGWWAAFWVCSHGIGNPFIDGMEIDIFEDYYTRVLRPGEKPNPKILDHNLHIGGSGALKSYNYNSTLPGSLDDFYVIGAKWTPFEVSYYLNGKLIASKAAHSPYSSVTFDAFRYGTSIIPLHVIVSGQIMGSGYRCHNPVGFKFPEIYEVDRVRVYGWPGSERGSGPRIAAEASCSGRFFKKSGEKLFFRADVAPSAKTGARIKAVHLFDNGYWLATRKERPYDFVFSFDEEFYSHTTWMRPGRSGIKPSFPGSFHAFSLFAEDENGNVSFTEPMFLMVDSERPSAPFEGRAQAIPGRIVVGRYDEGGQGVAYYDSTAANLASKTWRKGEGVDGTEDCVGSVATGEWLRYTVDIAEAGEYVLGFTYGTPARKSHCAVFVCDGAEIGRIALRPHEWADWRTDTKGETVVTLPAGRHVLTVVLFGQFNFSGIEFRRAK